MIYINENDDRPLYLQIYDNVRSSILSGAAPKDTPLPPIRVLSENLKVSKNTVEHVYQELLDEGLIRSVVGSGYYVNDISGMRFSFPTKDGHLEKYIRKASVLSDRKFKILSNSLEKYLPKDVETIGSSGTHILVKIRCCTNERELIAFMKERGIGIHGIKKNYNSLKAPENVFILGFSSISEEKIESYVKHLADALNEFISSKQSIGKVK